MIQAGDKRSLRMDWHLGDASTREGRGGVGGSMSRLLGILMVVLVACSTACGQFLVQPMRMDVPTFPGKRTVATFAIENQKTDSPITIDLRLMDVTQDRFGMWQTVEPDAEIVADPNGARWVNVGNEDYPVQVDVSKLQSCLGWLRVDEDVVELQPVQRRVMNLWINVPAGVQGYYCAALVAQTRLTPDSDTGLRAPVLLQMLVPIIIHVQGRPIRDEIELTGANLTYRQAEGVQPAATVVTLGVRNAGGTYARLYGVARVYGETGGHWRKITEIIYPQTSIIPGVNINLQQDMERPLPSGKYRVESALYVNNRRADVFGEEIDFNGDPRIRIIEADAVLNLDPREVPITVFPGATRTAIMKVTNESEAPVLIDAALLVPEHMADRGWADESGNSILGRDFGCVDWVTIEPTQFRLNGYGRKNLKIVSRMPTGMANPLPNYYATVKLRARFEDGQAGGTTQGLVYLDNREMQGTPRIKDDNLVLSESGPSRYIVTATFSNIGNTHVMPRCRMLLTEVTSPGVMGETYRDIEMTSANFEQSGNMLPLEIRQFSAVLDVASVPAGRTYYVTAVLQYAGGAAAQRQAAIRIVDEGGKKSVEYLSLTDVGGPIRIQL